jgi:transposase-like protein
VWPRTRGQRCWVHKTANVLNKLPNSQQSKAKRALQEIWMAETYKLTSQSSANPSARQIPCYQGNLQGILRKSGRLAKNCPQERSKIS